MHELANQSWSVQINGSYVYNKYSPVQETMLKLVSDEERNWA